MAPNLPDHAATPEAVLDRLQVQAASGLTGAEAKLRLARYGPNTIESRKRAGILALLWHQFESPVVLLLGAAAGLAGYFNEIEEAVAIIVVLGLNTLIGFVTEFKATRSIEALRALGMRTTRVRRDKQDGILAAELLVPGDIVILDAGDAVPADLRLIECANLQVDESTLTGESVAVSKSVEPVPEAARLADRHSMLFKGTALVGGSVLGVVVCTGLATELGQVSQLVAEAGVESSPIERKLARLSTQLVWIVVGLSVGIASIGILTGKDAFLMAEAAIALAVAAIPEGLPIVATLVLARGMWRMARQNALIERLSAVETLGATTIILTDKTGTLTENRMTVRSLWLSSGEVVLEDGAGPAVWNANPDLASILETAVFCNDAALNATDEAGTGGSGTGGSGTGDPMEVALLRFGLQAGYRRADLLETSPLALKHAFESGSRMMATVHATEVGFQVAVKGAPEAVLAASRKVMADGTLRDLGQGERDEWLRRIEDLGNRGFRLLACATKRADRADVAPYDNLVFLGLIGLEDPARADVPAAIAACRRAGIRVIMVTGDHAVTARSIGRSVGLDCADADVAEGAKVAELAASGGDAFARFGIFARVNPKEKLDLVRAYQAAGEIVAMTGDGVNDAPALRQADIGIAMGLRGTDVAREAAAMILLDDAFPTLVAAIREGRVIFSNIRRFTAYLLACNMTEVLVVGLAVLSALPLPILPLQILYLNLITDVFPAFALALGEGEVDVLDHPPRDPRQPILGRPQWLRIVLQSTVMSAGTFGALAAAKLWLGLDAASTVTVTFLTLAFAQLWHVFNMRSQRSRLLHNEITRNRWIWGALALCTVLLLAPPYIPALAQVLGLVPPDAGMWALVFTMSAAPVVIWQAFMVILSARRK